jgi:hypothetical protein
VGIKGSSTSIFVAFHSALDTLSSVCYGLKSLPPHVRSLFHAYAHAHAHPTISAVVLPARELLMTFWIISSTASQSLVSIGTRSVWKYVAMSCSCVQLCLSCTNVSATPTRPNRPVRPMRCRYVSGSASMPLAMVGTSCER